jgi:23S rRNA (cytosine1962-C5)-methyltransferase
MTRLKKNQRTARTPARSTTKAGTPTRRDLVDMLVPTLFEDDAVLAVDKPAGVDVGGSEEGDAAGIVEILGELRRGSEALHVVNRLSRFESGVLLLAKSGVVARRLRAGLKQGEGQFEYLAVCRGRMPRAKLTVGGAPEQDPRKKLKKDSRNPGARKKKKAPASRSRPKKAEHPTALQRVAQGPSRVLVRCRTTAPTTHLLRAQLRSADLRLVGDALHDRGGRRPTPQGTMLHLTRLMLEGPNGSISVRASGPPPGSDEILQSDRCIERPLHAALLRRLPLFMQRDTNAHRLLSGAAEDFPGVTVERFDKVLVVALHEDRNIPPATLKKMSRWYGQLLGTRSMYVKTFVKSRADVTDDIEQSHTEEKPFTGKATSREVEINERGLRFAIRPYDGFSVGLFLDQRDNRTWVRKNASEKDVLNLFAYTCGFSVAAATGGAKSTVNVDLSPNALEWGKTNFALNNLDLDAHSFFPDDAFDFLRRATKKDRMFDMIIVDPPSFAHGRKRGDRFSVADDLPDLVRSASMCLRDGGQMVVCTNHRKMSPRMLRDRVKAGLSSRRYKVIATPGLPADFAVDRDHAKSVIVQLS